MVKLQLSTPGVYPKDIFPTPTSTLATGVPAFLGLTSKVPKNYQEEDTYYEPRMLTVWTQFEQYFSKPLLLWTQFEQGFSSIGVPQPTSYLAYAIRGFFENGGRQCYVLPLKDNTLKALEKGLAALASLGTIDLICAPDIMRSHQQETNPQELVLPDPVQVQTMQNMILAHCDRMGDRFAILDAIPSTNVQQLQGNNGALYAPWLQVENISEPIPPCGHIAGIYARCDREVGIHRAPANYPLEGVVNLSKEKELDPEKLRSRVNYLQPFKGRGIRIWGANTLSQDPNWSYINVRRLFITVRRWVEMSLTDVAFEPNNLQLWLRIERELTAYCESLWQKGALKGNTPQEAFYVKCDVETNPPDVQEAGQVITELGLAPTTPNEFIVVSLIHGDSGVSLAAANPT